jgi:outer membrane protein OmpA-like peptidoglycan-associated protein
MRFATLSSNLSLLLAAALIAGVGLTTSSAFAQDDFEDEFDDSTDTAETPPAGGDAATTDEEGLDGEEAAPEDGEPAEEVVPEEEAERLRNERFLSHNTWGGATGGIRVLDAGSGPRGTFRVQLATDFFVASDFLNVGDTNSHVGGALSVSWTPFDFLEFFGSLSSYANSNNTEIPPLFQVLGDTTIGAKLFYTLPSTPWFTFGGDLTLGLLNTVGDIGLVGKSTSLGLRANATADFRRLASAVPFLVRFNLQYYVDNSSQLTNDIEQQRYDALPDPLPYGDETRNLLTRVERFALGINRLDRLSFALGLEAPLKASENFYISPMLEWRLGVPINRQGYSCLFNPTEPGGSVPVEGDDGCLDVQGAGAFPQSLTLGIRVLPPVRGLAAFAAVDIGVTGVSTPVRELAATAPYDVMLGLAYAFDTRPQVERVEVVREVPVEVVREVQPPPRGRIHGIIVERGTGAAIAGANIVFVGRDLTALHAGEEGAFTTYELDPGEVQFAISHPEYNGGTCAATIPAPAAPPAAAPAEAGAAPAAGAEAGATPVAAAPATPAPAATPTIPMVEVRCELEPLPRLGTARANITGDTGAAVGGATAAITGPMSRQALADSSGNFTLEGLTPGSYTARIEAEGFLLKIATFDVRPRETTNLSITLVTKPRRATVTINRREIVIRRQINFATDSDVIDASSTPLLTEIADVMLRNPQITKIELQGHTDNVGSAEHNVVLSQSRADAVRRWLIEQGGVDPNRLEAKGYGAGRPLVPNITPSNRARNRRTQFIILEQVEAAP